MQWTDERVEEMHRRILAGESYGVIAASWGAGITRNMLIGKARRAGISNGGKPIVTTNGHVYGRPRRERPSEVKRRRPCEEKTSKFSLTIFRPRRLKVEPIERPEPLPIGPEAVTICDLQSHHCRWIYGEPTYDALYCGRPIDPDAAGSWCAGHAVEISDDRGLAILARKRAFKCAA